MLTPYGAQLCRGAATPSWVAVFSPFPREASFFGGGPHPPWVQPPLAQVSGALLAVQPAPGAVSVPGSLRQSLGIFCLPRETEKVLNNGGLRINPHRRPLETPRPSGGAVFAARLWDLWSVWISNALTPHACSKQLELPNALRKVLTSAPSQV